MNSINDMIWALHRAGYSAKDIKEFTECDTPSIAEIRKITEKADD